MAILDCSVQQSMEGTAVSSSYRHSTNGMERELAAAERLTLVQKSQISFMTVSQEEQRFVRISPFLSDDIDPVGESFDVNPYQISHSANMTKPQVVSVCVNVRETMGGNMQLCKCFNISQVALVLWAKLPIGVNVRACGCLSFCVSPVTNWRLMPNVSWESCSWGVRKITDWNLVWCILAK